MPQPYNAKGEKIPFALGDGDYVIDDEGDRIDPLLAKLQEDHYAAKRAVREIERQQEEAISIAKRYIEAQYAAEMSEARNAQHAASMAEDAYKVLVASRHPMVGKRVRLVKLKSKNVWSTQKVEVESFGVIEVVTSDTIFPENIRYKPLVGGLIVRRENGDGSLGKKFESVYAHEDSVSGGWELV